MKKLLSIVALVSLTLLCSAIDNPFGNPADNKSPNVANSEEIERIYERGEDFFKSKEYEKAFRYFKEAAEKGNAKAQYRVGTCYWFGHGIGQNSIEAANWYRKAAEQGNVNAQFELGNCYRWNNGVVQDHAEAVRWWRKAADQGHVQAKECVGDVQMKGYVEPSRKATEQRDVQTKEYAESARKAAEQRDVQTKDNEYYKNTKSQYSDTHFSFLKEEAEKGDAYFQSELGLSYHGGIGVKLDYTEAFKWFRKAAEKGNANAQYFLGYYYASGIAVTKDHVEAVKWYKKAADQGHAEAQYSLGFCYYKGEGVKQNNMEAVWWWGKAADQGHAEAKDLLRTIQMNRTIPKD